jgi:hypothetical protein
MTTPYTSGSSSLEPEPQSRHDAPSLGERLGDVTRDLSTLMRQEVALAKAEISQSASNAGKGIGMLVGAALAGFFLLLFLSNALWMAIADGLGYGWGALIVGLIWGIIALILVTVGRKELKRVRGVPDTADTLGKIPNALKGQEEKNL